MLRLRAYIEFALLEIGSMKNGTVREAKMLAAIRNRLYLCNAFGTQVHT